MFHQIKVFSKDFWVNIPFILSILTNIFIWIYIFVRLGKRSSNMLFLHYNVIFGVDLVGEWWRILFLPIGGLLIILINFILALYCYNKDRLISRFLTIFAGVFEIFILVAVYFAVDINL